MIKNQIWMDRTIRNALEEDLGSGDITTEAIIPPEIEGKAVLEAREHMVLAGLPVFCRVFELVGSNISFSVLFNDSQTVPGGTQICTVTGPLSAILKGERTALNFIQRMSGIATLTREYVEKASSGKAKILDTRKTVPGLRHFDKYAVRMGGGSNHRIGLFDGILIKDNHIAVAGSISRAVELAKDNAPHTIKMEVEVEVENLTGVKEAVQAGADIILLDNMTQQDIKKAVDFVQGKVLLEASGGVNLDNIGEISKTGVDLISVGALTHSIKAMDLSLEVLRE
ncbi:MAG: carboxylating nicotinate-nucleotide diphosphorylase [Deltaproteobacteria bacterium]|nr:carboxylating nicotinate-nucleotide diphosphorylase [Deltaproteobacteria bacterium]